ncbi:MAG TPA: HD-GYP domain-containing protein [Thermotogota bacterium]|nr:HD-GYP domain-containing protein [Thermotogota bacterium]
MKKLKDEIFIRVRGLTRFILIPGMIFGITASILLWYFIFNAKLQEINTSSDKYIADIEFLFEKVEAHFYTTVKNLLTTVYETGYDEDTASIIEERLSEVEHTTFEIDQINYYHINKDFIIHETDYLPDMGLDFSSDLYITKLLSGTEPGELIYDGISLEYQTMLPRLFAYIHLKDDTWFEIGIRFSNVYEELTEHAKDFFDEKAISLKFVLTPTGEEMSYFNRSIETGEAVLHHTGIASARYYLSRRLNNSILYFIISMPFYGMLGLLTTITLLFLAIGFFYLLLRRRLGVISEKFSQDIISINENVTSFHLSEKRTKPVEVNTDVEEIQMLSLNFLRMREEILSAYEQTTAMNEELTASYHENQILIGKMETMIDVPDYVLYLNDIEPFLVRSFERLQLLVKGYDFGFVSVIENGLYRYLDFRGLEREKMNRLKLKVEDYPIPSEVVLREFKKDEFYKLHPIKEIADEIEDTCQALAIPVLTEKKYYGSMNLYTRRRSRNQFTNEDFRIGRFFSKYLNGYLILKELGEMEEELQKETITALINLLEQHDPYTKGHSESVAHLASEFALFLNLSKKTAQDLYWAGIVHDMGKILIPHNILNKPGRLTEEEFETIKKHPVYAYDALKDNQNMKDIARFIRHHHEKYNGNGYPDGISGCQIPFESRILALADSWDAMIAERVYKKGIPFDTALEEIRRNSGIQFDPELVDAWIKFVSSDQD